MALSDVLNIGSKVAGLGSMVNPALAPVSIGLSMFSSLAQSQNKNNNPKRVSPGKIITGDPLGYKKQALLKTGMGMINPNESTGLTGAVLANQMKIGEGVENLTYNTKVNNLPSYSDPYRIPDQFLPNALNPNNVGANNNLGPIFNNGSEEVKGSDGGDGGDGVDLKSTNPDMLEMLGETGKAAGFADKMNKVSLGLAGVSAVTGLISEMNADKPRIAPYVKSNRVNLNSDTSAFENASEASTDKLYRSTLSSLINRGLSPVMANAVAGSMKNNASNETLAKAEQFRTQTENKEAGMNAEVSVRNAQGMNEHNRFVEESLAKRNQMGSENLNSHLSSLIQIPAMLGQSKMDKNKFITDSFSALFGTL